MTKNVVLAAYAAFIDLFKILLRDLVVLYSVSVSAYVWKDNDIIKYIVFVSVIINLYAVYRDISAIKIHEDTLFSLIMIGDEKDTKKFFSVIKSMTCYSIMTAMVVEAIAVRIKGIAPLVATFVVILIVEIILNTLVERYYKFL